MMRINHLFISPGHNFFGHHGRPPGENPIFSVEQIQCVAHHGIVGDRFYNYKAGYKGPITFFSMEVFQALRLELNLPQARPEATRRNVFITGLELNALIGIEFVIQGVRFRGIEECRPCYWMNTALGPGAEEWLQGRGGLRAAILTTGILRPEPPAQVPRGREAAPPHPLAAAFT